MDGVADERVKPDLLRDTFRLIDFEPYDVYRERQKKKNQQLRQERNGISFGNIGISNMNSKKQRTMDSNFKKSSSELPT